MTTVLIIFGVLGVVSLFMFFAKRSEEKERKAQKQLAAAQRNQISTPSSSGHGRAKELLAMKPGDAVSITGDTYTISEKLIFREGNFEWVEYKLSDGSVTRWLEIEDDDELWLALYEELDEFKVPGGQLGDEIEVNGVEYELDEKGYASMRKAGEPVRGDLPECRYFDYEGEEDEVFSVEQWGENYEASIGHRISPHAIEYYPGK